MCNFLLWIFSIVTPNGKNVFYKDSRNKKTIVIKLLPKDYLEETKLNDTPGISS